MIKANSILCQRFWQISRLYWLGSEKWGAITLLAALILLTLVATNFDVIANAQQGEVLSALAAQDENLFWTTIKYLLGAYLILTVNWGVYNYIRKKLTLYWRAWLTRDFLGKYFQNRAFYELSQSQQEIDNPDQRIAEDINKFTDGFLSFFCDLLHAFLQVIAFSAVLWRLSPTLTFVLLIYVASGTAITIGLFGSKLVKLNYEQRKQEGHFRFGLVRLRENAESVAFYRGEAPEMTQLNNLFSRVLSNFNQIIITQDLYLNAFVQLYKNLHWILPAIIIAPQIWSGDLEIGKFAEAQGAFNRLFWAVFMFIRTFNELVGFVASIERLAEFDDFLQKPKRAIPRENIQPTTINTLEDGCLAIKDLTLYTPNHQRTLFENVSAQIETGQGMLVMGMSGCGKSSLLRAIAGLWHSGTGTIIRPQLEEILFVPQRPYMVLGTLRDQLLYPQVKEHLSDQELHQVLEQVNLPNLAQRFNGFNAKRDWSDVFSLGEQQRIAFARILINQPKYVILDEATSALDVKNEENLYRYLLEMGTTFINVGHRPTLTKYHHLILELSGHKEAELVQ
ncbi:MAG: ABC transporter ATP-binding protein/permease [Xenococcus sp. (in: cyanobacteria)]